MADEKNKPIFQVRRSPVGEFHYEYNLEARNPQIMAQRIAEWNTLAWAAENAKSFFNMNIKLISIC